MSRKRISAIAFALFVCLMWATTSHAQMVHYRAALSVGAHGGLDMSRMFFNPSAPQKMPLGPTFGVMFRYVEESHFGLIAEVNFIQRGWAENFEPVGDKYNYRRKLNYVELPVMAHIFFGRRGKFFFNLGPQISYMLSNSTTANFDPFDTAGLPDFPNTNRVNVQMTEEVKTKFDYGICAGLGGEFSFNPRNSITLEARFYYGLGNVFPSKRVDYFNSSNQMSIAFMLGYWFRFN